MNLQCRLLKIHILQTKGMPKKRARLQEKSSHMMDLRLDFDPGIRFEPEELHISPPTPEASTTECVSYLPMNDPFHFPSQTSFPSDDSPGLIYHTPDPEELFSSAVSLLKRSSHFSVCVLERNTQNISVGKIIIETHRKKPN